MADNIQSASAIALAQVLEAGGDTADTIKQAVHRTQLWRYCRGLGRPDADTSATLHRLSGGVVAADGWGAPAASDPSEEPRGAP